MPHLQVAVDARRVQCVQEGHPAGGVQGHGNAHPVRQGYLGVVKQAAQRAVVQKLGHKERDIALKAGAQKPVVWGE